VSGAGIKRKHLGEKAWRDLLTRHEASGLGVTAFCRREGVGVGSLRLWRARLKTPPAPTVMTRPTPSEVAPTPPVVPTSLQTSKPLTSTTPKFIELGTLGQASVGTGRLEIKLDLGGGLNLHIVRS
jgi:putative transposase